MDYDRRYVLAALTLLVGAFTAYFLRRILPTVFFAITVAYLLAPAQDWFERRGLSSWWASFATTATMSALLVGVVSPLLYVLYLRSGRLLDLLARIPDEITVTLFGYPVTVTVTDAIPVVRSFIESVLLAAARVAPVLTIKLTVFAIVVFALLMARGQLHDAIRTVVPRGYHDVVGSLASRARETLFAIYVLQAATAAATFTVAVPIFLVLQYDYAITLATIAGVLQFIPIVGPSVLIGGMALVDLVLENATRAILVAVLGLVFVAYLPDPVVRPRLARRTADLPGSLYFVGFTGGLFTMGVVGVIAGPLLVALLSESVELLAAEMDEHRPPPDEGGPTDEGFSSGNAGEGDDELPPEGSAQGNDHGGDEDTPDGVVGSEGSDGPADPSQNADPDSGVDDSRRDPGDGGPDR